MKKDEFAYVNSHYGLKLKRGTRLKFVDGADKALYGKKGTVAAGDGAHIMILVDGDLKPTGPFHPTSGILYEDDIKSTEPDCPEHRKLEAISKESNEIGGFLDWLMSEKKLEFAFYHKHGPSCDGWNEETGEIDRVYKYDCLKTHAHDPVFCDRHVDSGCDMPQETLISFPMGEGQITKLLAEYFKIDQAKLEDEKVAMIDSLRAKNAKGK